MNSAEMTRLAQESVKKKVPSLSELIIVVYGEKKVGKSTFASRFPNPLFLDCEDALRSVVTPDGKRPAQVQINSWSGDEYGLVEWTRFLGTPEGKSLGYKTIIVDGLNEAYFLLRQEILAKHRVKDENEGDLAYGKGGRLIRDAFRLWFHELRKLTHHGYGIVLTAHEKTVDFENNGVSYNKKVPLVDGSKDERAWDAIKPAVDAIFYAYKKQGKDGVQHLVRTKGNQLHEAADPTHDARLPDNGPFSYQAIEQAYNGGNK